MLGFMFAHNLSTVKGTVIELDILTGAVDIEILLNNKKKNSFIWASICSEDPHLKAEP